MKRNFTLQSKYLSGSETADSSQEVFLEEEEKEKKVPGFLLKTFEMLENKDLETIVSWSLSGKSFVIQQSSQFAERVLPFYFKHKNISSFIRQLNMYDFHKFRNEDNHTEWEHSYFVRGKIQLLAQIKRKLPEFSQKLISEVESENKPEIMELKESSVEMKTQVILLKKFHLLLPKSLFFTKQISSLFEQMNSMSSLLMNAIQEQEELKKSNATLRAEFNSLLKKKNLDTLKEIEDSADSMSDTSGNESSAESSLFSSQFQAPSYLDKQRESESERPETMKLDLIEKDFDEFSENYQCISTDMDEKDHEDFNFIRLDSKQRLVAQKSEDYGFFNHNSNQKIRKNSLTNYLENNQGYSLTDLDGFLIC